MNNVDHTPGPWKVQKDRRAAHPSSVMAGATCVAKCNEYVREVENNARLIAAAPELLALVDEVERLSVLMRCNIAATAHMDPLDKRIPELTGQVDRDLAGLQVKARELVHRILL